MAGSCGAGFVEFDDVNGKVLTYSAADKVYKVRACMLRGSLQKLGFFLLPYSGSFASHNGKRTRD